MSVCKCCCWCDRLSIPCTIVIESNVLFLFFFSRWGRSTIPFFFVTIKNEFFFSDAADRLFQLTAIRGEGFPLDHFLFFFPPFLQVRQIDYSNSRSSAVKVSLLTIGQQAVMDSYLCLMHLTTGIYMHIYIYIYTSLPVYICNMHQITGIYMICGCICMYNMYVYTYLHNMHTCTHTCEMNVCVCVCVCVCVYTHIHTYMHTYMHIYTYIYTYIYGGRDSGGGTLQRVCDGGLFQVHDLLHF